MALTFHICNAKLMNLYHEFMMYLFAQIEYIKCYVLQQYVYPPVTSQARSDALSRLALAISQLIETLYSAPLALHLRNNPTPVVQPVLAKRNLQGTPHRKLQFTREIIFQLPIWSKNLFRLSESVQYLFLYRKQAYWHEANKRRSSPAATRRRLNLYVFYWLALRDNGNWVKTDSLKFFSHTCVMQLRFGGIRQIFYIYKISNL